MYDREHFTLPLNMDFMSRDFDLAENVFYFHNAEIQILALEKFYSKLLSVSIVIWFISIL